MRYYETDTGFIRVSDQSPAGFTGVLYLGLDETGGEQVYAVTALAHLHQVSREDVPDDALEAFGETVTVDEPVLDLNGDLLDLAAIRRRIEPPAAVEPGSNLITVLTVIAGILFVLLWNIL